MNVLVLWLLQFLYCTLVLSILIIRIGNFLGIFTRKYVKTLYIPSILIPQTAYVLMHAWDKVGWLTDWMLRDHGDHVTLCVMSVHVGLLPLVLPTTQVSDLYLAINNYLVFYLVFCEQLNFLFQKWNRHQQKITIYHCKSIYNIFIIILYRHTHRSKLH